MKYESNEGLVRLLCLYAPLRSRLQCMQRAAQRANTLRLERKTSALSKEQNHATAWCIEW